MSLSRQLRRAAERNARKQERKATRLAEIAVTSNAESNVPALEQSVSDLRAGFEPQPVPARTGPTGPRTPAGKAVSSLNNLRHGLTGAFRVMEFESQSDFDAAHEALIAEHRPTTPTESELIRRMAEHVWLSRRAQNLQDSALSNSDDRLFVLYMRYQTTNDRGFRACLNDLFRLRREQREAAKQFESQNRAAEIHDARVRLANARAAHFEIDTELRSQIDAPIPGYSSVPVEQIKELFQVAMMRLKREGEVKAAA